jgi:hypothetical protein
MPYLLLAVALCVLVPWLPYLVYRRLPRRAPPPPGAWQLDQLAAGLRPEAVAAGGAGHGPHSTDFIPQAPPPAGRGERRAPSRPRSGARPGPAAEAPAVPRLTIPPYWWANVILVTALIVSAFGLGFGWAALFHYLGEARARSFGPAVFLFKPFHYGLVCFLPGLLLGICSAVVPALGLTRLLLGRRRFHEYLFWEEGRMRPEGGYMEWCLKAYAGLGLFVAVLCTLFVWQALNWYARFGEDEIAIKRLLGVGEEVHPYDTVTQIVFTSHAGGGKQPQPGERLHLRFRDGRTWSTDTTFHLPPDDELNPLLEFLATKTGKPITHARRIEDVPGW